MAQFAVKDSNLAAGVEAIDRAHLARMTFGEAALERELLELFDRQAGILVDRMHASDGATVAALAHTLKGSAVGVGAGEVAAAAARRSSRRQPRKGSSRSAVPSSGRVPRSRASCASLCIRLTL